jgi:hypothetical protein
MVRNSPAQSSGAPFVQPLGRSTARVTPGRLPEGLESEQRQRSLIGYEF